MRYIGRVWLSATIEASSRMLVYGKCHYFFFIALYIFTSHSGTYIVSNFVSNYGPTLLSECQKSLAKHNVPLASNQIAYSLIGRHNGAQETVDKCNELGIKVLAYYPFAMVRSSSFFNYIHPSTLICLSLKLYLFRAGSFDRKILEEIACIYR